MERTGAPLEQKPSGALLVQEPGGAPLLCLLADLSPGILVELADQIAIRKIRPLSLEEMEEYLSLRSLQLGLSLGGEAIHDLAEKSGGLVDWGDEWLCWKMAYAKEKHPDYTPHFLKLKGVFPEKEWNFLSALILYELKPATVSLVKIDFMKGMLNRAYRVGLIDERGKWISPLSFVSRLALTSGREGSPGLSAQEWVLLLEELARQGEADAVKRVFEGLPGGMKREKKILDVYLRVAGQFFHPEIFDEEVAALLPEEISSDRDLQARVAILKGIALRNEGKVEEAEEKFAEASKEGIDSKLRCEALRHMAVQRYQRGEWQGAIRFYRKALKTVENGSSSLYYDLAVCYDQLGDQKRRDEALDRAEALAAAQGDKMVEVSIRQFRGRIATDEGDIRRGLSLLEEIDELCAMAGHRSQKIYQHLYRGDLYLLGAHLKEARKNYLIALDASEKLGARQFQGRAWIGIAIAALMEGNEPALLQAAESVFALVRKPERHAVYLPLMQTLVHWANGRKRKGLEGLEGEGALTASGEVKCGSAEYWRQWLIMHWALQQGGTSKLELFAHRWVNSKSSLMRSWGLLFLAEGRAEEGDFESAYQMGSQAYLESVKINRALACRAELIKTLSLLRLGQQGRAADQFAAMGVGEESASSLILRWQWLMVQAVVRGVDSDQELNEIFPRLSDSQNESLKGWEKRWQLVRPQEKKPLVYLWDGGKIGEGSLENEGESNVPTVDFITGTIYSGSAENSELANTSVLLRLFLTLLLNPQKRFAKEELIQRVWFERYSPLVHDAVVYNAMSRLRKILSEAPGGFDQGLRSRESSYYFEPVAPYRVVLSGKKPLAQLELNSRQLSLLNYLKYHGSITRSAYVKMFPISPRTALRDLTEGVSLDILTREGGGQWHSNRQVKFRRFFLI